MAGKKRYSVALVHLYPWPYAKLRKPVLRTMRFSDEKVAFEEAILLALRQEGVAVVNDELERETIAMVDSKKNKVMRMRNNPSKRRRR